MEHRTFDQHPMRFVGPLFQREPFVSDLLILGLTQDQQRAFILVTWSPATGDTVPIGRLLDPDFVWIPIVC